MRKTLIIIMISMIMVLPGILFAQNTDLTSVESDFSYSLFPNELDYALNVGEEFSQLNNLYLFCGLGNLVKTENVSTMIPTVNNLLWAGIFMPGTLPYSLFGGGYVGSPVVGPASGTTYTWAIPPVTVGNTDYEWIDIQTNTQYEIPLFGRLIKEVQFLTMLGQMNIGAYLSLDLINNNNPTLNYTSVKTDNYNTAGAGVIPTVTTDYIQTTKYIDRGIDNTIKLMVPIYMKNGTQEQVINAGASINWTDRTANHNASYAISNLLSGVPLDAANPLPIVQPFTQVENNLFTRINTDLGINANYLLKVPGLFGGSTKNKFAAGINTSTNLLGGTYQWEEITQNVTFTPGDASFTLGQRNDDSTVYTLAPTINFDAELFAQHTFYFSLAGMAEFGIMPNLSAGYALNQTNPNLASSVNINRTDTNANGVFTDAADTVTTTTSTYSNTVIDNTGNPINNSSDQTITVHGSLPSALKIKPASWLFGLILGAEPLVEVKFLFRTAYTSVNSNTVHTVDGTGAIVGTDAITNSQTSNATTTTTVTYKLELAHNAGVFFDLNEDVHLSVNIAAAASGGVWDIRNLIIQGIIKLPAKSTK